MLLCMIPNVLEIFGGLVLGMETTVVRVIAKLGLSIANRVSILGLL